MGKAKRKGAQGSLSARRCAALVHGVWGLAHFRVCVLIVRQCGRKGGVRVVHGCTTNLGQPHQGSIQGM